MGSERREPGRRAEVVRTVVQNVVQSPRTTVTLQGLQEDLQVPREAASRIVKHLVDAGLIRQVREGVWVRDDLFS